MPTLGKVLRQAGYATACIGKWHPGFGTGETDWNAPLTPGPNSDVNAQGQIKPDAPAVQLYDLQAAPPSGRRRRRACHGC